MVGAIIAGSSNPGRLSLLEFRPGYSQVAEYRADGAGSQITPAPVGNRRPCRAVNVDPNLVVPAALPVKLAAQAAQLAREFSVGHAITFTSSTVPVSTGTGTIPSGRG